MWSMAVGNIVRVLAVVAFLFIGGVGSAAQSGIADAAKLDPIASSHGKPVVLIFLRTDCPVSQRYAPTIQKLAAKYAGRATFWLVFPSKNDSVEIIAGHTREYGYTLAALRDPDQILVGRAKATITPEAALFDAKGALRYHGRLDDLYISFGRSRRTPTTHDLDDALRAVLAGETVTDDARPAVGCYIADVK
jgi:thiol-disulfide isomerase/thioredoxin